MIMNNKISIKQNIANWIEKNKTTYYIISVIFFIVFTFVCDFLNIRETLTYRILYFMLFFLAIYLNNLPIYMKLNQDKE